MILLIGRLELSFLEPAPRGRSRVSRSFPSYSHPPSRRGRRAFVPWPLPLPALAYIPLHSSTRKRRPMNTSCARSEIECVQHYTFGCANFIPIKGSLYTPVRSPSDAVDHQDFMTIIDLPFIHWTLYMVKVSPMPLEPHSRRVYNRSEHTCAYHGRG